MLNMKNDLSMKLCIYLTILAQGWVDKRLGRSEAGSIRGWVDQKEMFNANRAWELRSQHNIQMHTLKTYSGLTKMTDYQFNMRANRPGHSIRYPRFVPQIKTANDPEYGELNSLFINISLIFISVN